MVNWILISSRNWKSDIRPQTRYIQKYLWRSRIFISTINHINCHEPIYESSITDNLTNNIQGEGYRQKHTNVSGSGVAPIRNINKSVRFSIDTNEIFESKIVLLFSILLVLAKTPNFIAKIAQGDSQEVVEHDWVRNKVINNDGTSMKIVRNG